jgi:hypothetical protein
MTAASELSPEEIVLQQISTCPRIDFNFAPRGEISPQG